MIRMTALTMFQWRKQALQWQKVTVDLRSEEFRKHFENASNLQNIDRVVQIKVLIFTIPAYGVSALITGKMPG